MLGEEIEVVTDHRPEEAPQVARQTPEAIVAKTLRDLNKARALRGEADARALLEIAEAAKADPTGELGIQYFRQVVAATVYVESESVARDDENSRIHFIDKPKYYKAEVAQRTALAAGRIPKGIVDGVNWVSLEQEAIRLTNAFYGASEPPQAFEQLRTAIEVSDSLLAQLPPIVMLAVVTGMVRLDSFVGGHSALPGRQAKLLNRLSMPICSPVSGDGIRGVLIISSRQPAPFSFSASSDTPDAPYLVSARLDVRKHRMMQTITEEKATTLLIAEAAFRNHFGSKK